jgi:hypothetical protein
MIPPDRAMQSGFELSTRLALSAIQGLRSVRKITRSKLTADVRTRAISRLSESPFQ